MTRTSLILLGGLLATVGGVAFIAANASVWGLVILFDRDFGESYLTPLIALVLLVAIVAVASIVALYVRGMGPEVRSVLVTALVSFIGLGMLFYYSIAGSLGLPLPVPDGLILWGALLTTIGLVAMGIVVMISVGRVLPWWCGVALIAGSPLFAFLGPILGLFAIGIAWALVGFAIFRAGAHQAEQPSRVR